MQGLENLLSRLPDPLLHRTFGGMIKGEGLEREMDTRLKPDLQIALNTYKKRPYPGNRGWNQDVIQAALLGLIEEAGKMVVERFSTKHEGSRFPAFWGPNFDWIPDQRHGNAAMIALHMMLPWH